MSCNATWRCVFSPKLLRPVQLRRSAFSPLFFNNGALTRSLKINAFLKLPLNFNFTTITSLSDSENGPPTTSSSEQKDHELAQEAVLKAISEVSKTEGRVGKTTNVVIGDVVTDNANSEWLALDQKVNSYPMIRGFTAIGTGGYDFVQSMVVAVESVILQPVSEDRVRHRLSSRGNYVSVNIGPVKVISSDQVQAVYNAMRRDERVKYFL